MQMQTGSPRAASTIQWMLSTSVPTHNPGLVRCRLTGSGAVADHLSEPEFLSDGQAGSAGSRVGPRLTFSTATTTSRTFVLPGTSAESRPNSR